MSRTYEEIVNGPDSLRSGLAKKGVLGRLYHAANKTPAGRFLRNATIVAAIAAASVIYGARNSAPINNAIDNTASQIRSAVQENKEAIACRLDYVLSETPKEEQDIGKILYSKKEEYTGLLNKEPGNSAASEELQKLDALINAYEQIYNSKQ